MLPVLPMTTALDFNTQVNPLSDQISRVNHNQSRVTWKDRIVSVLPVVVSLTLSAIVLGALWVAGVSTLIAGAAALATFASVYTVIKLAARKVQLAPPKSLLSPQNPLNRAYATVPASKKSISNDGKQTQHQVDVLKSDARIQSQKLTDTEHQRAAAVQLNKTLQEQNAVLQETGQQTADQLHLSQTEIHDKDQEITGSQQQSIQLKEQLTQTRDQYSKCAQNNAFLWKHGEPAASAVKKPGQELEQSIQIIDGYNANITRSMLRLEHLLARAQQSHLAIQQTHLARQLEQKEATIRQNTQSEKSPALTLKQVKEAQQISEQQFLRDKHNYQNELKSKDALIQEHKQQFMALQTQLQSQTAKENARTREFTLLQSDLIAKAFEIEQLQKQHNDLKEGFGHQKSQYQAELNQLRETHQKLVQERNHALQLQAITEKEVSELKIVQEKHQRLTLQLEEKEAVIAKMECDQRKQVEKHQQAMRTLDDKHHITETSLNEQLRTVMKAHEKSSTALTDAQAMNQALLSKTSVLEMKLRETESERETNRSELQTKCEEITALNEQLALNANYHQTLQLTNEQFQQSLLEKEKTSQALQEALEEASTALMESQKQCKLEKQRVETLQKKLSQTQVSFSTLQDSVCQAREDNRTLRSTVKSMKDAITEISVEQENALLQAEFTLIKGHFTRLQEKFANVEFPNTQSEIPIRSDSLDQMRITDLENKQTIRELSDQLNKEKTALLALRREYEEFKHRVVQTKNALARETRIETNVLEELYDTRITSMPPLSKQIPELRKPGSDHHPKVNTTVKSSPCEDQEADLQNENALPDLTLTAKIELMSEDSEAVQKRHEETIASLAANIEKMHSILDEEQEEKRCLQDILADYVKANTSLKSDLVHKSETLDSLKSQVMSLKGPDAFDSHWLSSETLSRAQSTSALDIFHLLPRAEQWKIHDGIKQELKRELTAGTATKPNNDSHRPAAQELKFPMSAQESSFCTRSESTQSHTLYNFQPNSEGYAIAVPSFDLGSDKSILFGNL